MRLSRNTELAVVGILIVVLASGAMTSIVSRFLSTTIGRIIGLAAIVYTWKYVSPVVSLLLIIGYVRCSRMVEGFDTAATTTCTCPPGFTWSGADKLCKKGDEAKEAISCTCVTGKTWDPIEKKCVNPPGATTAVSGMEPSKGAEVTPPGPVTNTNTITSPTEAAMMAAQAVTAPPPTTGTGVTPTDSSAAKESFSPF
jgi:hypothetical protein